MSKKFCLIFIKLGLDGAFLFIGFICVSRYHCFISWGCVGVRLFSCNVGVVVLWNGLRLWTVGWYCLAWLPFCFCCCILMDWWASRIGVFLTYVLSCQPLCFCSIRSQKCSSAWVYVLRTRSWLLYDVSFCNCVIPCIAVAVRALTVQSPHSDRNTGNNTVTKRHIIQWSRPSTKYIHPRWRTFLATRNAKNSKF